MDTEIAAVKFGSKIREARKAAKLNQAELAERAGVGRRYIVDPESGKPTSWIGPALVVAEILGFEVEKAKCEDR